MIKGVVYSFKQILPNLASLTLSEAIARSLNFLANIFIARFFTVSDFGKLGFVTSLIAYLGLFINFGYDVYGIREVAKDKTDNVLVNNILSVKLFMGILSFILVLITSVFFQDNTELMLYIFFGITLISSSLNLSWYFQAIEKMQKILRVRSIGSIIYFGLVILLSIIFKEIFIIPIGLVVSQVYEFFAYSNNFPLDLKLSFDKIFYKSKNLFKDTYLLGLSSFFILIYYNLDMVMLGFMKSNTEVGIYNSAYKIFLIFIIPFQLILNSYFPKLSQNKPSKSEKFKSIFNSYALSLLISGIIFTTILYFFAGDLINIIYGNKYSDASIPLSILAFNVFIIGINIIFGNPLIAWGRQKRYLAAISLGAVTNVILNIILIPKYSYNGAAFATLLSEIAVFIGLMVAFNTYYFKAVKNKI